MVGFQRIMGALPFELDLNQLASHPDIGKTFLDNPKVQESATSAFKTTMDLRDSHQIGFFELADDIELARKSLRAAENLSTEIDTLVVLGIGGSSLGPQALYRSLTRPFTEVKRRGKGMPRRLFFPDNSDPETLKALLTICEPGSTVFNVITKSGGTAETAAQFLVVFDWLEQALGDRAPDHLIITTDPKSGTMREIARDKSILSFEVPPSVGGRFSVLSAVGLVPAALAGLDVLGLLEGARKVRDLVVSSDKLDENPALLLAALLHHHDREHQRRLLVMMPYLDAMYPAADWFRQLWAESLGKNESTGPVPIAARGATDQHSQLQLYAEGPDDKVYLFVTAKERGVEVAIPKVDSLKASGFDYLAGHGLGELIDAQLRGTMASLAVRGRPQGLLALDRVDAESVGGFFMLMQAATAFAGPLYGVNPFDQPGVEEAKRFAFAGLGRAGYEKEATLLNTPVSKDSRYYFE